MRVAAAMLIMLGAGMAALPPIECTVNPKALVSFYPVGDFIFLRRVSRQKK